MYSKSGISSDKVMHFRGGLFSWTSRLSGQLALSSKTLDIARKNFGSEGFAMTMISTVQRIAKLHDVCQGDE